MMEETLLEIHSVRRFAGVELRRVPDESTILRFRHLLDAHDLVKALLAELNRHLAEKGFGLSKGTIVDASIFAAPTSTQNQGQARDPEMYSTRKGNQWHFGMKLHVGVDAESGLVHSLQTTAAHVHDLTQVSHLLPGQERRCGAMRAIWAQPSGSDCRIWIWTGSWPSGRPPPPAGTAERRLAGGTAQGRGAGQGGVSLSLAQAGLWLCPAAVPGLAPQPPTPGHPAGFDQSVRGPEIESGLNLGPCAPQKGNRGRQRSSERAFRLILRSQICRQRPSCRQQA